MGRPLDEDIIIKILERWQKAFKENSHYVSASDLSLVIKDVRELPTIQSVATDTNVGDKISKFIDGLEEIFADLRERHVDDSVCGLCEYDGAYIGESGDWCNECPGFERDDCFKLSDKTRKEWTEEIIKALPTVQPEPTDINAKEAVYNLAEKIGIHQLFALTVELRGEPIQPEPQWIPVSERLPKEPGYYITSNEYNGVGEDFYYDGHFWNADKNAYEVIAWMPKPEHYKPNK